MNNQPQSGTDENQERALSGDDSPKSRDSTGNSIEVFLVFGIMGIVSIGGMFFYILQFTPLEASSVFASGIIVAMSAFLVGGLLGVLFGIPKTLQHGPRDGDKPPGKTYEAYGDNTNLEEISDWLTKALVGIGLSQIPTILDKLGELAEFLKPAFGNLDSSAAIAISLVILFTINGFFTGYVQARIILAKLLKSVKLIKNL